MSTYRIKGSDGVVIESEKFLELPKAPSKSTSDVKRSGMIRYNDEWKAFEGTLEFTDGSIEYRRFASLDDNGRLLTSQLPDAVISGLKYIGTFSPLSDDIDPPIISGQYDNLPQATVDNSGNYFIVRGIYDSAVTHFNANNPSTSPVTFTPTNPSGEANWLEIKYYFSADPYDSTRKTITNAFGRIIIANVPTGTTHYGLQDLANDPDLTKNFNAGDNPSSETALTDTDWVISDGIKWSRQRQSRTSILAGAVLFDRTQMYSSHRILPDSPTGTVQNVIDSISMYALRRTGDAMYDAGVDGSGRLAFLYGTAVAPSITFNNNSFDPLTNPGTDPSKWSDNKTGIYHPNVTGGIGFTSNGTEKLRIIPSQVIFYTSSNGSATIPHIIFNGTGNTNMGIVGLNNKTQLVSNNAINVSFEQGVTNFYGNSNISGNIVVDGNSTIKGTSTFTGNAVFSNNITVNGNGTIKGNTVLGDSISDTLTVEATSKFNQSVSTEYDLTVGTTLNVKNVAQIGLTDTDAMYVNATSYFSSPVKMSSSAEISYGMPLIFNNGNKASIIKESTSLNFSMEDYSDITFLDGSAVRTKFNRYGIKLPVLSPTTNTVGEDGMIAFSSEQKTVVQKIDGMWKAVGSSSTTFRNFTVSSWILSGSYYQIPITQTDAKNVTVQYLESDGTYSNVEVDTINMLADGVSFVIKIPATPDMRFAGRAVLQ